MNVLDESSNPLPQQRRFMVENPYARNNNNNAHPIARPPQYQYQNQTNLVSYATPRNYGPPVMMPPSYHGHYATPLQQSHASPYHIHQMTNSVTSHYSASRDVVSDGHGGSNLELASVSSYICNHCYVYNEIIFSRRYVCNDLISRVWNQ